MNEYIPHKEIKYASCFIWKLKITTNAGDNSFTEFSVIFVTNVQKQIFRGFYIEIE